MKNWIFITLLAILTTSVHAKIVTEQVIYTKDEATFEGSVVFDDENKEKKPGVLIVHQWTGLSEYEMLRAVQLAELGYIAFVADIYGQGVRPEAGKDASEESSKYKDNIPLMRERVNLALETFKQDTRLDAERIAAIGYCFGGTVVLELARSGADIASVISFHGALKERAETLTNNIKTNILVFHGTDDPYVDWEEVTSFRKEMQESKANWQLTMYGKAVHAFSQAHAGDDPSKGAAYNKIADERSFAEMLRFFEETLK